MGGYASGSKTIKNKVRALILTTKKLIVSTHSNCWLLSKIVSELILLTPLSTRRFSGHLEAFFIFWSVYFVRLPLPFELLQQCNKIYRLSSKRLLFWCYSPCSEDSEKDSCWNKIKTACYNCLSIICCTCRHWKRHNRLMKRIISSLQFFSMFSDLYICNVLALGTTSCSVQYGYEIFMLERKCYCDNQRSSFDIQSCNWS